MTGSKTSAVTRSSTNRSKRSGACTPATVEDRQLLPIASAGQVRRIIGAEVRSQWLRTVLALVFLVAGAALELVPPALMGRIVDLAVYGKPLWKNSSGQSAVWLAGGVMLTSVVMGALSAAIGFVMIAGVVDTVIASLRARVMAASLRLPIARIEKAGSGDVISRTTDDVAMMTQAVNGALPTITGAGFAIVVTICGMAALQWQFAVSMVVLIPIYWLAVREYRRNAPHRYAQERAERGHRASEILTSLRGLKTVRAFGLEGRQHQRIATHSWAVVRLAIRLRVINNTLFARANLAECVGMSMLLIVGYWLVAHHSVTVGGVTAATLFFLRLFGPIGSTLFVMDQISSAAASLRRVVGAIMEGDALTASQASPQPDDNAPGRGELAANGVTYSYGDHTVLNNFSVAFPAGKTTAVVGSSGAGKSTLAAVLAGIRQCEAGTVTLDGEPADLRGPHHRARTINLVTQEVHTFSGTLRDDLTLSAPHATDDDVWRALTLVCADSWVRSLNDGLDTIVGNHGHALSPAQAQQLALARVALIDPPVVILDEATAEAESAAATPIAAPVFGNDLERAAAHLMRNRTAVVIAHRLNQAEHADNVIVMSRGQIVERGTHNELVRADGPYSELWKAWNDGRTHT